MSTSSTDFRKIINLIDSKSVLEESLNEGPLVNKALAKLGNKRAQGRVDRDQLAKPMIIGYKRWLGRTNREGSLADIQAYLSQIGFTRDQAEKIITDHAGYYDQSNDSSSLSSRDTQDSNRAASSDNQDSSSADPVDGAAEKPVAPAPMSTRTPASAAAAAANPVSPDNASDLQAQMTQLRAEFDRVGRERELLTPEFGKETDPQKKQALKDKLDKLWQERKQYLDAYKQAKEKLDQLQSGNTQQKVASSYEYKGNALNEASFDPPLSRAETAEIFTKAAAFAHDNSLVRSRVAKLVGTPQSQSPQQSNPYGGYSSAATTGSSTAANSSMSPSSYPDQTMATARPSTPKGAAQEAINNLHGDIFTICKREGMTIKDIQELKDVVRSKSRLSGITDEDQRRLLALIGYAFLKTAK